MRRKRASWSHGSSYSSSFRRNTAHRPRKGPFSCRSRPVGGRWRSTQSAWRGRHATPRRTRLLAQRQSIGLQNRGRGFDSPAACQSGNRPPHGGLFSYRAARGGGFSMPARAKTTRRTAVTAVAGKLRHMVPTVMRDQVPYDPARPGRDPSKHSVSGSQGAAKSETGTEVKAGKASRDILTSYSWPPCW